MSSSLKAEFGARFREVRDGRKFSRAALAVRLGISPKTIQSWEMGRTFIENLSLIPAIERELGVSFAYLLGQVANPLPADQVAEAPAGYGVRGKRQPAAEAHLVTGPAKPILAVAESDSKALGKIEDGYIAAPLIKPKSARKEVADLTKADVIRQVLFPADWCPRGRVVIAVRMSDSAMSPSIPHGSLVLVDRRVSDPRRLKGRPAALWLDDRGLRIREIGLDSDGNVRGEPFGDNTRGAVDVIPERGDAILGRILGYWAPLR